MSTKDMSVKTVSGYFVNEPRNFSQLILAVWGSDTKMTRSPSSVNLFPNGWNWDEVPSKLGTLGVPPPSIQAGCLWFVILTWIAWCFWPLFAEYGRLLQQILK